MNGISELMVVLWMVPVTLFIILPLTFFTCHTVTRLIDSFLRRVSTELVSQKKSEPLSLSS